MCPIIREYHVLWKILKSVRVRINVQLEVLPESKLKIVLHQMAASTWKSTLKIDVDGSLLDNEE